MNKNRPQFGDAPPQYDFLVNPYPDMKLTSCPFCEAKTGQKKLPLVIHIDPMQLISLNYTCRYCRACDLLIAHKHEIELLLTDMFRQMDPSMIGNDYLIMGTMDKAAWRRNATQPVPPNQAFASIHDFNTVYEELRMHEQGWFQGDQAPPIRQPPASEDWVKREFGKTRRG